MDILRGKPKISGRVEIARSFAYRRNLGKYEHEDYFCSQKTECAVEDAEEVSEALYSFCKAQVRRAVVQRLNDEKLRMEARKTA